MTEDHVLLKWFRKALPNFGLKKPPQNNVQLLCSQCNSKKAGVIDYSDIITRDFMKQIAEGIILEVRKHEDYKP